MSSPERVANAVPSAGNPAASVTLSPNSEGNLSLKRQPSA